MQNKNAHLRFSLILSFVLAVGMFLLLEHCSLAEEVFDLGKVVITTTKMPQLLKDAPGSVTVVSEGEVKSSKAKNVGELLEKVTGVEVKNYGSSGISSVSIRGSSSDQVLIMVNGRPLNLASSGDVDLSLISLENVERIEVVRGPFSALYGSGALGGVVNIITKNPPEAAETKAGLSYGSFNTSSYTLSYGSGEGKLGYLFTASKDYSEGDRVNSWKDAFNLSGKILLSSLTLSGGYSQAKRGVPGSLSWPTPNATQEDKKSWFDLTYKWRWGKSNLSLKGFLSQDEIVYENPDSWGGPTKDTTMNNTYGANFQHALLLIQKHNLIWGIDWRQDEVDVKSIDGTSRIGGKRKITSAALYLQDEIEISSDFTMVAGARYDHHSVYGSEISPRVSFLYHIGELTSLRASWGRAFRSPTVDDLYWQEDWGGGAGMFGNPNLVPEKSSEYEIGIEHVFSPKVLGRLTFFSAYMNDLISWVQVSPWRWEAQNIDEAQVKGLEGEMKLRPWKKVSFSLNYTYLEVKDEKEFEGNFLPYRPQNKFSFILDYKILHNLRLQLNGKVVGERYTNRENTEKLPSYTLLGAGLTFNPNKKTEIFLKADNLLDEEYQDIKGYPMPGLTIKGGVEITL